jgi:hypothetical protein
VERFQNQGKPFVLIGVNLDNNTGKVRSLMKSGQVTWRSFSGSSAQKIASTYDVHTIPHVVLIDHKGDVRRVFKGAPDAKTLDANLEELIAAAQTGK